MNLINKTFVTITDKIKGNSLKARSSRGAMVLTGATFIERFMRLVRNMILARILAPDAFGTIAMVIVASSIFETLSDVGVRQSVIQNTRGADANYLNVAWWFQSLRGFGLYGIGLLVAPWISRFYDMPELLSLLRVAFIVMVFNGLVSPRVYVLEKKFQFAKFVFLTLGTGVLGTLLTIGLTFYLKNVWALVIGLVAGSALYCLLSFVLCPFRPRLSIDKECLSELLKFARGMLGLSLLSVIIMQMPVIVLGKVVSGEELGMYYLAFQLAGQPAQLFGRIIGTVLLPAFAEKQDDKESIYRAMLAIVRTTAVFGIPLLAFLIICARPTLSLVYGSQYAKVAVPFSLLCVWGLLCTQAVIIASILIGVGLPHLHRRAVALRGLILISLIYPSIVFWGLSGAAMAVVVAYSVGLIVPFIWMRRLINLKFNEYALNWLPGLGISLIVVVPTILLRWLGQTGPVLSMAVGVASCLGAWSVGLLLLQRSQFRQPCFVH